VQLLLNGADRVKSSLAYDHVIKEVIQEPVTVLLASLEEVHGRVANMVAFTIDFSQILRKNLRLADLIENYVDKVFLIKQRDVMETSIAVQVT